MKIKKRVQGIDIELKLVKIKDYSRYTLYQVCKLVNGKYIKLYKECYTKLQIREIIAKGNWITEEVFV